MSEQPDGDGDRDDGNPYAALEPEDLDVGLTAAKASALLAKEIGLPAVRHSIRPACDSCETGLHD